jgi:hypothetical protein
MSTRQNITERRLSTTSPEMRKRLLITLISRTAIHSSQTTTLAKQQKLTSPITARPKQPEPKLKPGRVGLATRPFQYPNTQHLLG